MSETVTRVRAGASTGTDAFGQPIPGADVEFAIDGALFSPGGISGSTAEPIEVGRAAVISEPTLYFRDARPDIVRTDYMRVRGVLYSVDGDPPDWHWGDLTGGGLVVALKRVGG